VFLSSDGEAGPSSYPGMRMAATARLVRSALEGVGHAPARGTVIVLAGLNEARASPLDTSPRYGRNIAA
jgi:hypothetical protein